MLVNATSAVADACSRTLRHVQCAKHFSVCEMGAAQSFCLSGCTAVVTANCSMALGNTSVGLTQTQVCGSAQHMLEGLVVDGKCFDTSYKGPRHTAWVIGFAIAVVFSFLASVGINLQKRALKQNELNAHEANKEPLPAYRLPLWVIGFVLILAGSILDFVAFGLAPQSLLAPLAALTLVWNMVRYTLPPF
jgi:magnesium transporter